jgi:hypothetical protein
VRLHAQDQGRPRGLRCLLVQILLWIPLLAAALPASVLPAVAEDEPVAFSEYKVKAAYLYNMARFVTWPESAFEAPEEEFVIALLGPDPFGTDLDALLADRTIDGRRIRVDRCDAPAKLRSCNLLFVSKGMCKNLPQLKERLGQLPILIVADAKGPAEVGGMITFLLEEDVVRFEVDQEAALKAGLKISSKMLGLARSRGGS